MVKARREVQTMSWTDFEEEFNRKFYNPTMISTQQAEFLNLQQGEIIVAKVVRKFEQLAKLCPYLVPTEEQITMQMLEMFRLDIALAVESRGNTPTTTTKCAERAYRVEY